MGEKDVLTAMLPGGGYLARRRALMDLLDAFIDTVDAMETTRRTYRKAMLLFVNWVERGGRRIDALQSADILAYKDYLLRDHKSAYTVNLYLSVIRKFYKWTVSRNLYPNIAEGVGSVRTNKETFRKMHLDSGEGARLLKEASKVKVMQGSSPEQASVLAEVEGLIALRNYAMVNLMLRTGLRTVEVSRADIGDITTRKGRRVLLIWGKGHVEKDDFVVLTEASWKPIRNYLSMRTGAGPGEPLFACEGFESKGRRLSTRRIQAICKDILRAIGLEGHQYSAHSLRHTTGTQILINGGTMFDVQKVLRHKSPVTSQLYVNSIMEDQRLEKAGEEFLDKSFVENEGEDN